MARYTPVGSPEQYRQPIDAVAGRVHFLDHLAPVWAALPPERRGTFWVKPDVLEHAEQRGVDAVPLPGTSRSGNGPVLCAAYSDLERAATRRRPLILMEHGCGLSFPEHHAGYAGGEGLRSWVSLFIAPNEITAAKTRRTFPTASQVIAGTPKLDAWHQRPRRRRSRRPVVAISFHWDGSRVCPEAGTAWPYYREVLPELAAAYPLLGHGHPKIIDRLAPVYEEYGIEVVRDFEEVLERADVYVNDCSSTLYEFASLDRPVVVLNAPWFRRDVDYGLRFWLYSDVGVQCDSPDDLVEAVARALDDPPEQQRKRREATEALYPNRGRAALVAATGIVAHCDAMAGRPAQRERPAAWRGWG